LLFIGKRGLCNGHFERMSAADRNSETHRSGIMQEEEGQFPIFSVEGDNYARIDDVDDGIGATDQLKSESADANEPPLQHTNADEQQGQAEKELPSSSQAIYDMDTAIDQLFTSNNPAVAVAEQLPAEVEYTLRTLRNRVTALELHNKQLAEQLAFEKSERVADHVHWDGEWAKGEALLEATRLQLTNEIAELKKKHLEEMQAKHALSGKVENTEKLRHDYDNLVLENAKLESKYDKAAGEVLTSKNELSHARSELNKLKADFARLKTDHDACKAELSEKISESSRLKKDTEQGRGTQEEQLRRLTSDKTRLEEQVQIHSHCNYCDEIM
jgi:chromosome segregation ATPase